MHDLYARLWIALYTISIHVARLSSAQQERECAIERGAAPFPFWKALNTNASSAAPRRPPALPHPLTSDAGGDGGEWERLTPADRRDAIKAVVRQPETTA